MPVERLAVDSSSQRERVRVSDLIGGHHPRTASSRTVKRLSGNEL